MSFLLLAKIDSLAKLAQIGKKLEKVACFLYLVSNINYLMELFYYVDFFDKFR